MKARKGIAEGECGGVEGVRKREIGDGPKGSSKGCVGMGQREGSEGVKVGEGETVANNQTREERRKEIGDEMKEKTS